MDWGISALLLKRYYSGSSDFFITKVLTVDIDGDGDMDVITSLDDFINSKETVWFENVDGLGTFGTKQVIANLGTGQNVINSADVDDDGDIDVLSSYTNKIVWYENTDGAGSFAAEQVISTTINQPVQLSTTDLDGDLDIDIVASSFDGSGRCVFSQESRNRSF